MNLVFCLFFLYNFLFFYFFFFFNDTATTEIYTLSLHDALPIFGRADVHVGLGDLARDLRGHRLGLGDLDRKSTRLNSSHVRISYAVFCLKKKKKNQKIQYKTKTSKIQQSTSKLNKTTQLKYLYE